MGGLLAIKRVRLASESANHAHRALCRTASYSTGPLFVTATNNLGHVVLNLRFDLKRRGGTAWEGCVATLFSSPCASRA